MLKIPFNVSLLSTQFSLEISDNGSISDNSSQFVAKEYYDFAARCVFNLATSSFITPEVIPSLKD